MNATKTALAAVLAPTLLATLSDSAWADAVIDPDSTGATAVSPAATVTGSGNLSGGNLHVGYGGNDGTLELNAQTSGNGVTSLVNIDNLEIAGTANSRGELRIIGNGNHSSATATASGEIRLGANSDSFLSLSNGGVARVQGSAADNGNFGLLIGSYADFNPGQGASTVTVDGNTSLLDVSGGRVEMGFNNNGGADSLTITNGGWVIARHANDTQTHYNNTNDPSPLTDGSVYFGVDFFSAVDPASSATDTLTIDGAGSTLQYAAGFFATRSNAAIEVLNGGQIVQVEEGGYIDQYVAHGNNSDFVDAGDFGFAIATPYADASLLISGQDWENNPSTVSSTRNIEIGIGETFSGFDGDSNPVFSPTHAHVTVDNGGLLASDMDVNISVKGEPGSGTLTVANGGSVTAQTVNVYDGGLLNGDGGEIFADVLLDGGTLSPGASPGEMYIDGDLEVIDGLLLLEIAGAGAGQFDQLTLGGDLIAANGLTLQIVFLNGFVPQAGDAFDLLGVLGDASVLADPSMIDATFVGLDPGTDVALNFTGGGLELVVPEPASLLLLSLGGAALISRRRPCRSR